MTQRLLLHFAAVSDVGRVRKDNQDSGYAGPHLLVVADGVGGAARGDVASTTAIQQLRELDTNPDNDPLKAIATSIDRAHLRIAELVDQHPELDGTSTTVTLAQFDGSRLAIGHVGDSRAYLLREGEISQITSDHTFVQSLVDEGRITAEEALTHPHRHLILRAVDGARETDPDLFFVEVQAGDRIMLCTDGASGEFTNDQIGAIVADGDPDTAAHNLVLAALDAGSSDNVTVIVADVGHGELPAEDQLPKPTENDETGAIDTIDREPMVVGAAADRRRGLGLRRRVIPIRRTETAEPEPIPGAPANAIQVDPIDPEELRYAPRPPRRFGWVRGLIALVVIGVLVYVGGSAAYAWSQKQYYVAPSDGRIAIWQGVMADLPGVNLHSVFEVTGTEIAQLSQYCRTTIASGIGQGDLAEARKTAAEFPNREACRRTLDGLDILASGVEMGRTARGAAR